MSEVPQIIPPEARQEKPKNVTEAISRFGSTFRNVIGKLDVTKSLQYLRIKDGFSKLDSRLTELEDAAARRIQNRLRKQGESFDRDNVKKPTH